MVITTVKKYFTAPEMFYNTGNRKEEGTVGYLRRGEVRPGTNVIKLFTVVSYEFL
jgi:hypothetical protein